MEGKLPASVFSQLFPKGWFIKTATAETRTGRSPCFPSCLPPPARSHTQAGPGGLRSLALQSIHKEALRAGGTLKGHLVPSCARVTCDCPLSNLFSCLLPAHTSQTKWLSLWLQPFQNYSLYKSQATYSLHIHFSKSERAPACSLFYSSCNDASVKRGIWFPSTLLRDAVLPPFVNCRWQRWM